MSTEIGEDEIKREKRIKSNRPSSNLSEKKERRKKKQQTKRNKGKTMKNVVGAKLSVYTQNTVTGQYAAATAAMAERELKACFLEHIHLIHLREIACTHTRH